MANSKVKAETVKATEEEAKEDFSKNDKVPVFIPKDPLNKQDDSLFVSVNGENCRIKKGEQVLIDKKFAEVIQRSQQTANEADEAVRRLVADSNSKELEK